MESKKVLTEKKMKVPLEGLPMEEVVSEDFQPTTVEILGASVAEEPAVEIKGGFVHPGRGKVILKFHGDNRRHYLSPRLAREYGKQLISSADAVENTPAL